MPNNQTPSATRATSRRPRSLVTPSRLRAATAFSLLIAAACPVVDPIEPAVCSVTSVSVTPSSVSVSAGGTTSLQASVSTSDCLTAPTVLWSSATPSVATVDAQGTVTGLVPGIATISATALGAIASATVTVTVPPVATVGVALAQSSLLPGAQTVATATARGANGATLEGRVAVWSSGNPQIASVDASGAVTAVSPGTTNITATVEGQSGNATVTVLPFPVASVTLAVTNASMRVGQVQIATATARDASGNALSGRTLTWSSSNSAVASVSPTGAITAVSVGAAAISVASEGQFAVATVTVTPNVASIDLTLAQTTLIAGAQTQATAVVRDAAGGALANEPVAFSSSNASLASVTSTGLVTSIAPGTVNITATSGAVSRSVALTINPVVVPIASILITPASASLQVGQSATLVATPRDAGNTPLTGRTISFTSSASAVAAVSVDGVVTAVAPGTATITATSEGVSANVAITVSAVPIASVQLTLPATTISVGAEIQASITVRDANNAIVSSASCVFSSSSTSVATVSSTGRVTGVTVGQTTLTATCAGGSVSSGASITVVGNPTLSVNSSLPAAGAAELPIESSFQITFSETLNATTVTAASVSLRLTAGGTAVAATRTVSGNRITITPTAPLTEFNTNYSVVILNTVASAVGNTLPSTVTLSYRTAFWDPSYYYRVRNRFAGDVRSLDTFSGGGFEAFMGDTDGFTGQFWYFIPRGGGFYSMQNLFGGETRGLEGADTGTRPFLTTGGLPATVSFTGMLWRPILVSGDDYLLRTASGATKSLATLSDVPQLITTPSSFGSNSSFRWYFTRLFKR